MSPGMSMANPERPTWQAAFEMIERHGCDAVLYAERSFELSMERGDFRNAAHWRLVHTAIEELLGQPTWRAAGRC